MEVKEIRQVAIQMQKLHREGRFNDVSCLLQDLQNTEVTPEQLQNTDVVKIIYQLLKSCPVAPIQKRAKDLLLKWRHVYSLSNEPKSVSKRESREHTEADVAESVSSSTQHTDQLLNYNKIINTDQEDAKDPSSECANSSKEGRSSPQVNDPKTVLKKEDSQSALNSHPQSSSSHKDSNIRTKCVEFLHQALKLDQGTDTGLLINLAQAIENQIYSLHGHNTSKYKSCIRSKIANIKNPKSPHLRQGLLSGTLDPRTFALMSAEEMASEELLSE